MKERARARNVRLSAAGRDIAPLPEIAHPRRRGRANKSFRAFCETYFPATFYLPWSPDHLKVMAKIERAVLRGGLFALAMPRGDGKTSLCEAACLWAILTGAQRFVALIGSDEKHAMDMLESLKTELECNELLLEDFPEAVYPVRCLEGIANRCAGQTYQGESTHIKWTAKYIVLAAVAKEALKGRRGCAKNGIGALIKVAGITGRVRGMKHKRHDGVTLRPGVVVVDDPQTDDSARSASQCMTRESILAGAVLGLAGPGKKIAGFMPCTVICPGDMADHILNRDLHPEWQGERTQMVYSFPSNEKLWQQYAEMRADSFRNDGQGEEATEFYGKHRKAMDKGAVVAWRERYNTDELSAIQHAMNLKFRDEAAFWAEYQNQPLPIEQARVEMLDADRVAGKTNGRKRGAVPEGCEVLTAFVDVQAKLLYYAVCAWQRDFTGYVLEYGTYPEQGQGHFTARTVQRTLRRAHQGAGIEGAIYGGLEALIGELVGREWPRDDGAVMRVGLCLIDQGWKTDVVHQFCRQSEHAAVLMPSRGQGIGASQKPISDYRRGQGDRLGHHWWIPSVKGRRALRHLEVDTNYWKTFVHERLATAMGDRGCLSIFGRKPGPHRLFAEHLTAEYRVPTEGRGRMVDEWKLPAHKPENHWLDCLVGCVAAASMRGVEVAAVMGEGRREQPRKRLKLSELQTRKRVGR